MFVKCGDERRAVLERRKYDRATWCQPERQKGRVEIWSLALSFQLGEYTATLVVRVPGIIFRQGY
jgi:hypothetical protein